MHEDCSAHGQQGTTIDLSHHIKQYGRPNQL